MTQAQKSFVIQNVVIFFLIFFSFLNVLGEKFASDKKSVALQFTNRRWMEKENRQCLIRRPFA